MFLSACAANNFVGVPFRVYYKPLQHFQDRLLLEVNTIHYRTE
jgi:hypothetical protein